MTSRRTRSRNPPVALTKFLPDKESREQFIKSWMDSSWLTNTLRKAIEEAIVYYTDALVANDFPFTYNGYNITDAEECRSDIRSFKFLLGLLP